MIIGKIIIINTYTNNIYSEYSFSYKIIQGKTKLILDYNPIGPLAREVDRFLDIVIESENSALTITFMIEDIPKTWKEILDDPAYQFIKDAIKKFKEIKTIKDYRKSNIKTSKDYIFLSKNK